jgi:hypothetical protein
MSNRRTLIKAIDDVENGKPAPGVAQADIAATRTGPDTVDGIAPGHDWQLWLSQTVASKRANAPWNTVSALAVAPEKVLHTDTPQP